ncbi:hypothetical protein [Deinococcus peraridilitoris]|uniref:Uncharacterized protein n=1 Tax=Deinococcus peraridilitoris (strain DSM 19664 / LMG 22246 / CIP 109416 / KR-200) TaxID=937777 RepID=L0A6I5_DEIPD|nr:hypothetical protein [Deinococcus peraridilitoris]AFZ69498.1 hypothetical protein Deipe_4131 [Deinococcus peraridilitoris DSM 19664]
MTAASYPRNEVLQLLSRQPLDYAGAVRALSPRYGPDAIEGAIFELLHDDSLTVERDVLRPTSRAATHITPWEYQAQQAQFIFQLVEKLNAAADDGWELVSITTESAGAFAAQVHVALLKRPRAK